MAVSCWITHFRDISWANDLDQVASRFAQYRRVMAHWQAVLPVPVLDVHYEEMVEDLQSVEGAFGSPLADIRTGEEWIIRRPAS